MSSSKRCRITALLLSFAIAAGAFANDADVGTTLPRYSARDASAAVVTRENLLASDRFWPPRVALTQAWQPDANAKPLRAETAGILIRVEPSGSARIDFGRDGIFEVPVDATDLIQRANDVRVGALAKSAPNFLVMIGPRLLDSAGAVMKPYDYAKEVERRTYLCVFADPNSEAFAELAAALAPIASRNGVLPIVFPQGRIPDGTVGRRLRSLEWKVPFVLDYLSEPYTRSLISEDVREPIVVLQSREGRVLFRGRWNTDLPAKLDSALANPA